MSGYYWIFGIEHAPLLGVDPGKPWAVHFGMSSDRVDMDRKFDTGRRKRLEELLEQHCPRPLFDFEVSKNWHTARVETREAAELLSVKIAQVLRDAGLRPMEDEEARLARRPEFPAPKPAAPKP
ncbi:MAG TPA: hypothetical protein VEF76_05555 [Patescibacteria group bacterium]|nr:hypothetical protein [Patescibacteria group bacterium]